MTMSEARKRIRVLIAEAHPLLREGMSRVIARQEDMELVGETDSGEEAHGLALQLNPDVLVLDFEMPGLNGVEVAQLLQSSGCTTTILVFSTFTDLFLTASALIEGVSAYLPKDAGPARFLEAIRNLAQRRTNDV
jgi:DNA-binding NarL/FixJ family response regulator